MSNNSEEDVKRELQDIYEAVHNHDPDPTQVKRRGNAQQWAKSQQKASNKQQITARFDADVIEQYKTLAGEGSYQRLMNQALREWLERQELRQVVREEMQRVLAQSPA